MASNLTFYTNPMSRGRIVRWMLEEVGAPYDTEILEYGGSIGGEAYLAINPMAKVPALRHGDQIVTEVAAICAYLADAFPEAGLGPAPDARGAYYRWLFFAAGPLEAAATHTMLNVSVAQEQEATVGYGNPGRVADTLEQAVTGREFIAGDRFSAADVYVGSHINWGLQMKTLEERPAYLAYVSPLLERPAHRRATEIDDALVG